MSARDDLAAALDALDRREPSHAVFVARLTDVEAAARTVLADEDDPYEAGYIEGRRSMAREMRRITALEFDLAEGEGS